jgi:phage gp29-like protein
MNGRLTEALKTVEAYFGRISYDAGPSWTRFSSYPATDLTPEKIIGAQQEATAGYPLRWEEMIEQVLSRDAHLSGIAQQRVDDVVKGSWRLVRSTNDDVAACVRSFCDEALRGVDAIEDGFAWLLWGNAYCYNATEVIWERRRMTFPGPNGEVLGPVNVIAPRRLDAVHPKHFRFDLRTDEALLWLGGDTVSLPLGKFIFYRGEGQNPITERRGYMWPCVWLSLFKSIGWAGWTVFVERFGLPTPIVQYGDVAQYEEHKAVFQDILRNLGRGFGAIAPDDVKVDTLQQPTGGRSADPHSALSDACDAAQSIRVLGATLTAKIGNVGSFAASTTHADVKYAREEADARRLWSVVRSDLLAPMVTFNAVELANALRMAGHQVTPDMIVRRVPRGLHRVPREIDPLQRAQVVEMAINKWGLHVGAEALYDEFNLPQPLSMEDVAPGAATQVSSGGALVGAVEAANQGAVAPQPSENGESNA